ncbi:MAG: hypothetical protein K2I66_00920 [Bacteroidales bacterium]|nr:hypothetical protein [Bacteroidales bacterium]
MKKILLGIIIEFVSLWGYGQIPMEMEYGYRCGMKEPRASSWCGGYGDTIYRPYIPYNYGMYIPVHVNLIFLRKNDGTGGFSRTDKEQEQLWNDIEAKVNEMYDNLINQNDQSCYLWRDPFLSSAKIKFEFTRVYVNDSYAWDRKKLLAL